MPALIQAQAAPRDRGLALGIWSTWMPTGIAAMMVIGYFGLGPLGWRGIFWICALLPAAAALLLTLASGPVGSAGPRAVGLSFRVLHDRNVIVMAGIFICFSAAFLLVMTFLPTILVDTLSFTPPTAALVGFAASLALLPANVSAGWLIGRGASATLIFAVSLTGMLVTAAVLFAPALGATVCVTAAILFGLASGAPPAVIWALDPPPRPAPGGRAAALRQLLPGRRHRPGPGPAARRGRRRWYRPLVGRAVGRRHPARALHPARLPPAPSLSFRLLQSAPQPVEVRIPPRIFTRGLSYGTGGSRVPVLKPAEQR
jgi:hypothetical protein